MQPIPTLYQKVRFRSRLEARWAVFMDQIDVEYIYEAEGFDLEGVWYLPDFWLPDLDCFIEIKPEQPTDEEENKAARLSESTGKHVYIFFGFPRDPWDYRKQMTDSAYIHGVWKDENRRATTYWDNYQQWCECPGCGAVGIEFEGRSDRIKCGCKKNGDRGDGNSDRLALAYETARKYRFY